MSLAIQIDKNGGPEELKLVDVTVGEPVYPSRDVTVTEFVTAGPPGQAYTEAFSSATLKAPRRSMVRTKVSVPLEIGPVSTLTV